MFCYSNRLLAKTEYEKIIIDDIVTPIPEMTRTFNREMLEVVNVKSKDGNILQIPIGDADFLKSYTDQNTRYLAKDTFNITGSRR